MSNSGESLEQKSVRKVNNLLKHKPYENAYRDAWLITSIAKPYRLVY